MILYIFILLMFALFAVTVWFHTRGSALTGRATVISRRVGTGRNYLVTFGFCDGDELELYVSEADYIALNEGISGTLVWHKNVLSSFEEDLEVTT